MAIQVGGTTVINNSRELVGITGADTATKNALEAAGIGGGTVGFTDTTTTLSTTFTKPNDAYSVKISFFGNNFDTEVSGAPSSSYEVLATSQSSATTIISVNFRVQNPNTHSLRGSYWGDVIAVGKKNTTTNKSIMWNNLAAGWTTQTQFPVSWDSGLIILDEDDQLVIWVSDAYEGQASANSNLVLGSGDAIITVRTLSLT